jgi:hypothetical protein
LITFKFRVFKDFGENGGFDASELGSRVFISKKFAYPPQRPPYSGIEMIFNGVVGSKDYLK